VSGNALAPEEKVSANSVLPMGYAEAKLVCEYMLDETLHRHPHFRAMAVRVGQISGSKTNGYWNPVEHLVHLIKSSQTLRALPDLDGVRCIRTPSFLSSYLLSIGALMVSCQRRRCHTRRIAP